MHHGLWHALVHLVHERDFVCTGFWCYSACTGFFMHAFSREFGVHACTRGFLFSTCVHQGILHTQVHRGMGTSQLPKEGVLHAPKFCTDTCTKGWGRPDTSGGILHAGRLCMHEGIFACMHGGICACVHACTKSFFLWIHGCTEQDGAFMHALRVFCLLVCLHSCTCRGVFVFVFS